MRRTKFENNKIYHIYNRGIEKRDLFIEEEDYLRFIHDLYEFNDVEPAGRFSEGKLSEAKPPKVERKMVVEIVCFCLMPNHFHLMLKQLSEGSLSFFMHKLGTGYSMYFNEKYERMGSLFQGTYKAVSVEDDIHFAHLSRYIHLNPVDLVEPEWKKKGIKKEKKINDFLCSYRWSSHLDYMGIKNFPSVINKSLIMNFFGEKAEYRKFIEDWTTDDYKRIEKSVLEERKRK